MFIRDAFIPKHTANFKDFFKRDERNVVLQIGPVHASKPQGANFLANMAQSLTGLHFKYYLVGEYGTTVNSKVTDALAVPSIFNTYSRETHIIDTLGGKGAFKFTYRALARLFGKKHPIIDHVIKIGWRNTVGRAHPAGGKFIAHLVANSGMSVHEEMQRGGANYEVMKMLLDIKDENNATNWVKSRIEKGDRIMGMGHAVYKTVDPRSMVLKELSKKLSAKTGLPWYNITKKVEETTSEIMKNRKERDIFPNVDLYSASVYYMLNIPMDLNTPIFAISRVSGWAAHVIEEKFAEAAPKPMLYRPKATYVGKYEGPQGCNYIPIEERK